MNEQPPKSRRRWFRFSLKSMMLLVALAAVSMSFIPKIQRARNQRQVVDFLDILGNRADVHVAYDYQVEAGVMPDSAETRRPLWRRRQPPPPPVSKWLGLFGPEYLFEVVEVHIDDLFQVGATIAQVAMLPEVRSVTLHAYSVITAENLAPLLQLHNLKKLELGLVNDKSIENIFTFERLESLVIDVHPRQYFIGREIRITDEGLAHIAKLPKLRSLQLGNGGHNRSTDMSCTLVSDEGLVHLYGLKQLESLRINSPQITQAGIDKLHKALPNCEIEWNADPRTYGYKKPVVKKEVNMSVVLSNNWAEKVNEETKTRRHLKLAPDAVKDKNELGDVLDLYKQGKPSPQDDKD